MITVLRSKLCDLLSGDTTLRTLLGKAASPYGVYFMSPPEKPDWPILTYYEASETEAAGNDWPDALRETLLMVTCWTKTTPDSVLDRVDRILREAVEKRSFDNLAGCEVFRVRMEWTGPDIFDSDWNAYARSTRFRIWWRRKVQ